MVMDEKHISPAADGMIDAGTKPARPTAIDGAVRPSRQLRDEEYVQSAVGKAEMMLSAARGCLFETIGNLYETLCAKQPIPAAPRSTVQRGPRARL
jgi:hypothetical protein